MSSDGSSLYITDWDLGEIVQVDPDLNVKNTLISGLSEPLGVLYTKTSISLPHGKTIYSEYFLIQGFLY